MAAGLVSAEREKQLLAHASQCEACAWNLRQAVSLVNDPPTEEQRALAESLPSSSEFGRKQLVRRLGARRRFPWWLAVAACLFAGAWPTLVWFANWQEDRQVTDLFRAGRPSEFRLAGMPYGPVELDRAGIVRTPGSSGKTAVSDPRRAARRAFLERDPARALTLLEQARREGDQSAELQNDLAVALAMLGGTQRAIELLDAVLAAHPTHTAALFNRALLAQRVERTAASNKALEQLKLHEPDAAWLREARVLVGER